MKTSELLTLAKTKLRRRVGDGKTTRYICIAIDLAMRNDSVKPNRKLLRQGVAVKRVIRQRLGGTDSLGRWLALHYNIINKAAPINDVKNNAINARYVIKLQETRCRWIDSLIAEYKAKGD